MSTLYITGANGSLGKTVVPFLLSKDHQLHLAIRNNANESAAIDNIQNRFTYRTDLSDAEATASTIESLFTNVPEVDACVFLSGGYQFGGLEQTTHEDIQQMIEMNFTSCFHTVELMRTHFAKNGKGRFVFIGAKAAMDKKRAVASFAYSLSKQLLYHFSELIQESQQSKGINAHILLIDTLDTPMNREAMPTANFENWTQPEAVAHTIHQILEGWESRSVIEL